MLIQPAEQKSKLLSITFEDNRTGRLTIRLDASERADHDCN